MARGSDGSVFVFFLFAGFLVWLFSVFNKKNASLAERKAAAKLESERVILSQQFNAERVKLHQQLDADRNIVLHEIETKRLHLLEKESTLKSLTVSFDEGYICGRKWLAEFIAEADKKHDDELSDYLYSKDRPAPKAAEAVADAKREKRQALQRLKFLEYQLLSYKEYFPYLEEFEDAILDEKISHTSDGHLDLKDFDKVSLYISKDEYAQLSVTEKNQRALDNYIKRPKSNWEIGRLYERYIGYIYECEGWDVVYHGAIKGFEDLGRDLICKKDGIYEIVQAKCWALDKVIREKHIFQLFGSSLAFEIENGLSSSHVKPVFVTTTSLSDVAIAAATRLNVSIRTIKLSLDYPMIKCNVNQEDKIYHLPFDQQYDRVKLCKPGEKYAKTVIEAEQDGFRRAHKFHFN